MSSYKEEPCDRGWDFSRPVTGTWLFKLVRGSDCSPKSLPKSQTRLRRIPHSEKKCLTQEEAKTIYDCLEADQVVSPIHFHKEIIKAPSQRTLAYQKLEEILEEEGSVKPYQIMLLGPVEEEASPDPFLHMDFYQSSDINLGELILKIWKDWSVLSTEMFYIDPPQSHPSHMAMDCKTTFLDQWKMSGKAPTLTGCEVPESPVSLHDKSLLWEE